MSTPTSPRPSSSTPGRFATEVGGIDVEAIKNNLRSSLHHIPRYRQRLQWIPFASHAVWVDDNHFDLGFHVRHTALPRPGSPEQLKRLSARIMAQPLDRKRPLWETWVVEGVDGGDSFALITKIHHCMIDGSSGVDLAYILLSPSPMIPEPEEPPIFVPRSAPSRSQLWRDEVARRIALPLEIARGLKSFVEEADDLVEDVSIRARALLGTLGKGLVTDRTPLNGKVGPHRTFDWLDLPLDDLKAIRKAWGCTINDVVLTLVTGAVREYLIQRGADPGSTGFRVSAPVSVRSDKERGQMGNRVSSWIVSLPLARATRSGSFTPFARRLAASRRPSRHWASR